MKNYYFAPFNGREQAHYVCKKSVNLVMKPLQIHNNMQAVADLSCLKQRVLHALFVVHRIIPQ